MTEAPEWKLELNSTAPPCEVLVTGHFLYYHEGHKELMEYASQFGDVTVGLNGNETNIVKYRDAWRSWRRRLEPLLADPCVKRFVIFEEPTPTGLILRLKPKHYVRGPDYRGVELPEAQACREVGAQIHIHPGRKIANSSDLLAKVSKTA